MAFSTYFSASLSPVKRRDSDGVEDIPVLNFRPFESAPKIIFKNVSVGERATKQLFLRNPQDEMIEVELAKLPPLEANLTFSYQDFKVHPHQQFTLEIIWQPKKQGKSIYSIHLKTNTNSRFYFSVVCVSVPKKPMKKSSMARTTATKKKLTLKSCSGQISERKHTAVIKKSISQEYHRTVLPSQMNAGSCAAFERNQCPSVEPKLTPLYSTPCTRTTVQDISPAAQYDKLMPEEELRNLSSETYDVVSPKPRDFLVSSKEHADKLPLHNTCTQIVEEETNIFSNFTFSPLRKPSSFQPRDSISRETFCLPAQRSFLPVEQLSPISHIMPCERPAAGADSLSEDSLSPVTPAVNRGIECSILALSPLGHQGASSVCVDVHGTPLPSTSQAFKTEMTLDLNLSPVQGFGITGHDISGISEVEEELENRFSDNKSTFEISLPCFTPLQVKKVAPCADVTNKMCMEDLKNLDSDLSVTKEAMFDFKTPCGSIQNKQLPFSATYLAFSPPQITRSAVKENISPQYTGNMSCRAFGKPSVTKSYQKQSAVGRKTDFSERSKIKVKKNLQYTIPKLLLNSKKRKNVETCALWDTDKILSEQSNPSYCITATIGNPFINCAVFYDRQWYDDREKEFVRWLNVLLTPPQQLNSSEEMPKVDVAELWKRCCKSDVAPAPSRETVSSLYLVNHRLDSLRRKAYNMFRLPSVAQVLSKVAVQIEKGILSVRKDRNVRDIGLKHLAIELLLCYNPLWLRIGLETIMGRIIPLESNSDIVGIAGFIAQHILSDPYLVQRYSISGVTNMFKPGYDEAIKKHILKKFFLLVYFLDYAKENKLIYHNPCLFCRDAQYKESRDLLLVFARNFLCGIGDVTKHLRTMGYVVKHKQTYLDEYNYAVINLGSDLRDGIRLAKVAEIILQDSSIRSSLLTPVISKLQKIHNVKVALTALNRAGHVVEGDIAAKNIVEGHKEKTMSLLWQILHKFQISRFVTAANKIQKWYRSLHIYINRKIHMRKEMAKRKEREERAIVVIQKFWRGCVGRKQCKMLKMQVDDLCKLKAAAVTIQCWFKLIRLVKYDRSQFTKKRNAVVCIQKWYRNLLITRTQRLLYAKQKEAAVVIQKRYRLVLDVRRHRNAFLRAKQAAAEIKVWYRACIAMKRQRQMYLKQLKAVHTIQVYLKAIKQMQSDMQAFNETRKAIITIQFWYRRVVLMRVERCRFLQVRVSVIKIQQWFVSIKLMKEQRNVFLEQRSAAMLLQRNFRARCAGEREKRLYDLQRSSIVKIQKWYRNVLVMRMQRQLYLKKRTAIFVIQERLRAFILGRSQQKTYLLQRNATLIIQRWYRDLKQMHRNKLEYARKLIAIRRIQMWFRNTVLMRTQRSNYLEIRASVIKIQTWFRAKRLVKDQKKWFTLQHRAAVVLQRALRSVILAKKEQKLYACKRKAAVKIQSWYRACMSMRYQKILYIRQKTAACKIQAYFRASKLLRRDQMAFERRRTAIRKIKVWYRSSLLTRHHRSHYLHIYSSIVKIQIWFRATSLMRQQRIIYFQQRSAAMIIQQKFRATLAGNRQRHQYYLQKKSVVKIQKWFRNVGLRQRQQTLESNRATIEVQRRAAVKIQNWYRSCVAKRNLGTKYVEQRIALRDVQLHVGASEATQTPITLRKEEAKTRGQRSCSILLRSKQREEQRKQARHAAQQAFATKIQAYWRGYKARKELKSTVFGSNIKPANTYTLHEGFSLRSLYCKGTRLFTSSSSYAVIQSAALLIESGVRLSSEICEEFLSSSHLDTLLYLLETMNRSVPAEKLLIILLKIVTHILRHSCGIRTFLEKEKTIPVLLNLTNIWCIKKYEILFCYFCTIWWLLGQEQQAAQKIQNTSEVSMQLVKCYTKVKTWNTHVQTRSSAIPQKNLLPDLVPSWSITKTDRPKMFKNPKFAITQVLKKLGITAP